MIRKVLRNEIEEYKAYAYKLALDFKSSGFPTYLDEIKTEGDFYRVIEDTLNDDDSEFLLYEKDGKVRGWIHYYWLSEDNYLSFYTFNVEEEYYGLAIDEFLEYIRDRFTGYDVFFGIPEENKEAACRLARLGFEKTEVSDVYIQHFKDYHLSEEDDNIIKVDRDNWEDFALLHRQCDDIYWNNERLYKAYFGSYKNRWKLFVYYKDKIPAGNIYFTYVGDFMEIFGVDMRNEYDEEIFIKLLRKALNESYRDGMKDMTYFGEEGESKAIRKVGLKYICRYVLYEKRNFGKAV